VEHSADRLEELRASRKRLVLAADAGRRVIERELHDGIQQDLVALVVKLQLARRLAVTDAAGAASLLDEIRREAQAALDATRRVALRAYPPVLDAVGLRTALRTAAAEMTPMPVVEAAFGPNCSEEIVAAAYFCCLELLEPAARIEAVDLHDDDGALVFDVVGGGSNPDLTAAVDRVEALGGVLTMVSEPDGRFRISGSLPLQ
jgi:signal transduction histidine kinase